MFSLFSFGRMRKFKVEIEFLKNSLKFPPLWNNSGWLISY